MLEIEDCLGRILDNVSLSENLITVDIMDCHGMVLGEDVISGMMVPHFPKSAMDGYAVRACDVATASLDTPVKLSVIGELLAGDYEKIKYRENTAVRVMTGAYVPEGYDAVIRQEDTDYGEDVVEIRTSIKPFMNYCKVGEDIRAGEVVIKKGTRLSSVHMGLMASLGIASVCVRKPVNVAIILTGSEIVGLGEEISPGKIFGSIAYMLAGVMKKEGINVCSVTTCADEEDLLKSKLESAVSIADFVITTGAVSVGKKDIVPKVLAEMGAKELFHGANIQPGTPTMASVLNGKVVLSLSGNPYAAMANFELYFWPAMAKMMGSETFDVKSEKVILASAYPKKNRLRRLIRAYAESGKVTIPSTVHASSVIGNLTECNCFIDLEAGRQVVQGDEVMVRYFKECR